MVPGIFTEEQSPVNYLWNFINMKHFHFPLLILLIWQTKLTNPTETFPLLMQRFTQAYSSSVSHLHSDYSVCGLYGVLGDFHRMRKRVSVWKLPRLTSWSELCQGFSLFLGGKTPLWVGVVPAFMSLWKWLEQQHQSRESSAAELCHTGFRLRGFSSCPWTHCWAAQLLPKGLWLHSRRLCGLRANLAFARLSQVIVQPDKQHSE